MERRLQKYLADCGLCSRRAAEQLIEEGRVTVNGAVAQIGCKVDDGDSVAVDGRVIGQQRAPHTYIMLHKPRGYITTMKDEQGRRCVADLLTGLRARAVPVGRLDRNSEGLLLLTNDGELLYRLTHPAHEVEKCYLVTLRGAVEDSLIEALGGELFLDGEKLKPVGVRLLKREPEKTVLQMTLTEGKNRQIRRMCEQVGVEVIRLKRVSEGGIRLAGLKSGHWRQMTAQEVAHLKEIAGIPSLGTSRK